MSTLTLEIVTPEGVAFRESVREVAVPTTQGEIGVLPHHIPLLTLLRAGELHVTRESGEREYLAVDRGFARVFGQTLSILTEAAIHVKDIDMDKVAEAQRRAEEALREAQAHPQIDPVEVEKLEAIVRFALAQKLVKRREY